MERDHQDCRACELTEAIAMPYLQLEPPPRSLLRARPLTPRRCVRERDADSSHKVVGAVGVQRIAGRKPVALFGWRRRDGCCHCATSARDGRQNSARFWRSNLFGACAGTLALDPSCISVQFTQARGVTTYFGWRRDWVPTGRRPRHAAAKTCLVTLVRAPVRGA